LSLLSITVGKKQKQVKKNSQNILLKQQRSFISVMYVEVVRELVALAQRTDFGHMKWTRPKHALEGVSFSWFVALAVRKLKTLP
jgi:hypothetical protein